MDNLLIAKWEEDIICGQQRIKLVFWGHYIDDVLLLWEGDHASLDQFIRELNANDLGIVLQHEASISTIHFF